MTAPEISVEHRIQAETCTLHVCTSCRKHGSPREPRAERHSFILYAQIVEAMRAGSLEHQVDANPAECLSLCPRPDTL